MRSAQQGSRHIIQDTRNIVHRAMMPSLLQSRHLGTSHGSPNHHQLPHHIFLNLTDGLKSFSFQFQFWEKARSHRVPNLGCKGAESPGWFDVLQKKNCTRHDAWASLLSWWSCQSSVARSCGLLDHLNSFHHAVHMLAQWILLPPLTSTVKLSLFKNAHFSPHSLAASSHWYNRSRYNGWNFSGNK